MKKEEYWHFRWRKLRFRLLIALLALTAAPVAVGYLQYRDGFTGNLLAELAGVAGGILLALVLVDRVAEYRTRVVRESTRALVSGRFEAPIRLEFRRLIELLTDALSSYGVPEEKLGQLGEPYAPGRTTPAAEVFLDLLDEVGAAPRLSEPRGVWTNVGDALSRFEGAWHEVACGLYPLLMSASDFPVISAAEDVERSLESSRTLLGEALENDDEEFRLAARGALIGAWNLVLALGAFVDSLHGGEDYLDE